MNFDADKIIDTLKRISMNLIDSAESIKSKNDNSRNKETIDTLKILSISIDKSISENEFELRNSLKLDSIEEENFNLCARSLIRILNSIIAQGGLSNESDINFIIQNVYTSRQILINSIKKNEVVFTSDDLMESNREEKRYYANEMRKIFRDTQTLSESSQKIFGESLNLKSKIEDILSEIISKERDANVALINAVSFAADTQSALSKATEFSNNLIESTDKKDRLFNEFENYRNTVSNLIDDLNKVGLAKSFGERRKSLRWPGYGWIFVFLSGISLLCLLGYHEILPLLKINSPEPTALIARFLVGTPLVWLTWFAARQYGHNVRLREDYAFKEAAALAFVGYRSEMSQDLNMLKLLQESAIKNFASNPLDSISQKDESASPVHELLEKFLSKAEPKQFIDAMMAVLKKDK